jgi:hypothetical protein
LRSITVDPMALEPMPPPNMSESPPPLPLCNSTSTMSTNEARMFSAAVTAVITGVL